MAWDGSGNFSRTNGTNTGAETWQDDAAAGTKIRADRHDTHDQDIADAIDACLTQNNESKPTAHFLPNATASYNLGSASAQWQNLYLSGVGIIDSNLSIGDGATDGVSTNMNIGANRTGAGNAFIDFHAEDSVYTDYALRLIRDSGENGAARLQHRGTGGLEIRLAEAAAFSVLTSNTTRVTVAATGEVTIVEALTLTSGNLVFPATQNASADANTLDDYDEGTWTPTIQDNSKSDGEGQTYSLQEGYYTKIGNVVYISGQINLSALGTLSGDTHIAGLPFTSKNVTTSGSGGGITITFSSGLAITGGENLSGFVADNATTINLMIWDATAGTTALQANELTGDGVLYFHGHYFAAS